MTEIRPIRQEEADSFLRLLCDSFDLDFERAKAIFYREPMFDLDRKWAYLKNGSIESILTTVPLAFGWGNAIGIAGVATKFSSRGQGFGEELLREVMASAAHSGEGASLLFAKRTDLYERVGFSVLDRVIRAPIHSGTYPSLEGVLPFEEVERLYDAWSNREESRLRRDERRWNYWKWNLRVCCPVTEGYVCVEGAILRECIATEDFEEWPVPHGTEWFGLESLAQSLHLPLGDPVFDLHLMGSGFDSIPQLFLTDQF